MSSNGKTKIKKEKKPQVFMTGGSGLMGQFLQDELAKEFEVYAPTHKELDILDTPKIAGIFTYLKPEVILHLAAYTDVAGAEKNKQTCYDVNVLGTRSIVTAMFAMMSDIASTLLGSIEPPHLIYISTEYVFSGTRPMNNETDYPEPTNFYGLTKLLGEAEAYLWLRPTVLRTTFKPRPYKHKEVPVDMFTSGDYVDVIGKQIVRAIELRAVLPRVLNIGTGRKRLADLARQTRNDIVEIDRKTLPVNLPRDASLDTKLWETIRSKNI